MTSTTSMEIEKMYSMFTSWVGIAIRALKRKTGVSPSASFHATLLTQTCPEEISWVSYILPDTYCDNIARFNNYYTCTTHDDPSTSRDRDSYRVVSGVIYIN